MFIAIVGNVKLQNNDALPAYTRVLTTKQRRDKRLFIDGRPNCYLRHHINV